MSNACPTPSLDQLAKILCQQLNLLAPSAEEDVLVNFIPDHQWTLFDHVDMRDELEAIFGRKVDLISKSAIERSRNYIRRKNILNSAQVIYAVS